MIRPLTLTCALTLSATGAWADQCSDCRQFQDLDLKIRAYTQIIERGERVDQERLALADVRKALEIKPPNQAPKEGLKHWVGTPEPHWWRGDKSVEGTRWRSVATPVTRLVEFEPEGVLRWGTPWARGDVKGTWSQTGDVVELEISQCVRKLCTEGRCNFIIDNRIATAECTWYVTSASSDRKERKTSMRFQKIN